jgi:hypothetical protein
MLQFLWVIDDFLANAEQVRAHALSLTYSRTGTYPGRGSVEQMPIRGLQEEISSIVRQPLAANWPANHAHATCRVTLAEDAVRGPGLAVPKALRDPIITVRNRETLQRLELMAAGGAGA